MTPTARCCSQSRRDGRPRESTTARRAFALIELLIVVAIIAILAAIAMPSSLEAQVRAKVSRATTVANEIAGTVQKRGPRMWRGIPRVEQYGDARVVMDQRWNLG